MNLTKLALAESKTKLSTTRAAILSCLVKSNRNSASLGRSIGRSAVAIGGILSSLEKAELIQRQRDKADRRKVVVSVTDKGLELLSQFCEAALA
jgi:DNA-binding MarR family transcriptional regulator